MRIPRFDRWTVARGLIVGLFATGLAFLSIRQRDSYSVFDADLAINDQLVWSAAHGRPFVSTLIEHADIALGDHFSFVTLYHAPLYWFWSDPRMLLIAQAITVASAAIPLGWLADLHFGGRRGLSTAFVVAYVLLPALHFLTLFEWHEVAPALPATALLLWALESRRTRLVWVATFAALTVKEEMAIVCFAVGIYLFLAKGQRRLGAGIAGLSAVWGLLTIGWIMPALNTAGGGFYYLRRYSQYGDTSLAIVLYVLQRPQVIFADLFAGDRIRFYVQMLGPLAGLPLLAPTAWIIALPIVGYLALGNSAAQYSIHFHYTAPLVAPLFLGAILGGRRLLAFGMPSTLLGLLVIGSSLLSSWIESPLPPFPGYDSSRFEVGTHAAVADRMTRLVPGSVPVSAGRNLVSRFSQRERVFNFPNIADAQYVLVDNKGQVYPGFFEDDGSALRGLVRNPDFWLAEAEDGVWLFQRGVARHKLPVYPTNVVFGDRLRIAGYDLEAIDGEGGYRLTLWWTALRPPDERYTVFLHLLDSEGKRVWQQDSEPLDGLLPTVEWPVGAAIPDRRRLDLRSLGPSTYRLLVGMYEWGGGEELSPSVGGSPQYPGRVLLTDIQID